MSMRSAAARAAVQRRAGGTYRVGLGGQGAPAQRHAVPTGILGTQLGQGVGQDQARLAAGGRERGQADLGDGL
jgi:hypothetical protein